MAVGLTQWRAAIGAFGTVLCSIRTEIRNTNAGPATILRHNQRRLRSFWIIAILTVLLIIGGVELNPGPGVRGRGNNVGSRPSLSSATMSAPRQPAINSYIQGKTHFSAANRNSVSPRVGNTTDNVNVSITDNLMPPEEEASLRSILLGFRDDFNMRMDSVDKNFLQLKTDFNLHVAELEEVKKEVKELHTVSNVYASRLEGIENQLFRLDKESKEVNILIKGFQPFEDVCTANCIDAVEWLLTEKLALDQIYVSSARVISKPTARTFSILATIPERLTRERIFGSAYKLKGTDFYIQRDYTLPERRQRSQLLLHRRRALDRGSRATLTGFTLRIDDKYFKLAGDRLEECQPPASRPPAARPLSRGSPCPAPARTVDGTPGTPRELLQEEEGAAPPRDLLVTNESNPT